MTISSGHGFSRRTVLLLGTGMAALGGMPARAGAEPLQLRVAVPGADAASLMAAMGPAVEKSLALAVQVMAFRTEPNGRWPIEVVYLAPPGSMQMLVAGPSHLFSFRTYSNKSLDPAHLTKIMKLTRGESYGVAVPRDARGGGLATLAGLAKGRALRIAVIDTRNGHALFADLLGRQAGVEVQKVYEDSADGAIRALATGTADAAVINTSSFVLMRASHPDLRLLATSGAKRSSNFPTTPTLAEITGEPKLSFTLSLGRYGPPRMSEATAKRIDAAVRTAAAIPSIRQAASKLGYVLDPLGPDGLAIDFGRVERAMRGVVKDSV